MRRISWWILGAWTVLWPLLAFAEGEEWASARVYRAPDGMVVCMEQPEGLACIKAVPGTPWRRCTDLGVGYPLVCAPIGSGHEPVKTPEVGA